MRPLTPDMLDYAAQDTRYLLELKDHMKSRARRDAGGSHWAEEEFARLEGTRWEAEESMEGFLRLKGARDLIAPGARRSPRSRELARHRRGAARSRDLPRDGQRSPVRARAPRTEEHIGAERDQGNAEGNDRARAAPTSLPRSDAGWKSRKPSCRSFRRVSAGTRIATSTTK